MCTDMQVPFEVQYYPDLKRKESEEKPKAQEVGAKKVTGRGFFSRVLSLEKKMLQVGT